MRTISPGTFFLLNIDFKIMNLHPMKMRESSRDNILFLTHFSHVMHISSTLSEGRDASSVQRSGELKEGAQHYPSRPIRELNTSCLDVKDWGSHILSRVEGFRGLNAALRPRPPPGHAGQDGARFLIFASFPFSLAFSSRASTIRRE